MGSWNFTCGISNLPIFYGEEVYAFLVDERRGRHGPDPVTLPILGTYDDYGRAENFKEPEIEESWKQAIKLHVGAIFGDKDPSTVSQMTEDCQRPVFLCMVRKEVWEAVLKMTSHGGYVFDPEESIDHASQSPQGLGVPFDIDEDNPLASVVRPTYTGGTLPLQRYKELIFVHDVLYTCRMSWKYPAGRGSQNSFLDANLRFHRDMHTITQDLIDKRRDHYDSEGNI